MSSIVSNCKLLDGVILLLRIDLGMYVRSFMYYLSDWYCNVYSGSE